ncbi:unnamed protein product [Cuscuta campestris]|uniref:Uncharacterized protein n=1 Tax=Cuscuta campestris TaxID=132261 RepID=A0A484NAX3_9ASTE|nr:unnamed protein product [Cuscuta campestris]
MNMCSKMDIYSVSMVVRLPYYTMLHELPPKWKMAMEKDKINLFDIVCDAILVECIKYGKWEPEPYAIGSSGREMDAPFSPFRHNLASRLRCTLNWKNLYRRVFESEPDMVDLMERLRLFFVEEKGREMKEMMKKRKGKERK